MKTHQQGSIRSSVLLVVVILIIMSAVYWFLQKKPSVQQSSFNDSDLIISYSSDSIPDNSAPEFNAISSSTLVKADSDFLTKYVATSSKETFPLAQAQKILANNQSLLKIFDTNAEKPYQCNLAKGETCMLNEVRNLIYLGTLRSLVELQQKKINDGQKSAVSVADLGKNITAHADSEITLLVGWVAQKLGYEALLKIPTSQKTFVLTDSQKSALIAQLRSEHKKVLQYDYVRFAESIDYITSANNKPQNQSLTSDEEEAFNSYRQAIAENSTAWNPQESKKYFYDSYKKMVANIDLPCGSTYPDSKTTTNFDPKDQKIENYIGKMMYSVAFASIDGLNTKRCEVENAIQSL